LCELVRHGTVAAETDTKMFEQKPHSPEQSPILVGSGGTPNPAGDFLAKIRAYFIGNTRRKLVAAAILLAVLTLVVIATAVLLAHGNKSNNANGAGDASQQQGTSEDAADGAGQGTQNSKSGTSDKKTDSKSSSNSSKAGNKSGTGSGSSAGSSSGGTSGSSSGGSQSSGSNPYPDRWSVGAPGVARYNQTQASLPVPAGYTEVFGNGTPGEWDIYDCSTPVTYDHYYFHTFIYIGTGCSGNITIKNSIIAPPPGTNQRSILNNSNGGVNLVIQDTTIRPEPVSLGGTNDALTDHAVNSCGATCNVTLTRLDVSNSGGMCLCGENTLVQNSWLHDLYIAHLPDPSVAHTGGVFPYGGSGPVEVSHNRLEPGYNAGTGTEVTDYWKAITAVLFTQSSGGTQLHNYNVHDNFISLGAFDMDLEDGINIIVKNNVFGPTHWGNTSTCSSGCTVTYSDWSSNVEGDINGVRGTTVVDHP
jgi:hypothetical protein